MPEFNDIVLRDKEKRLSISRLPKNVKEEFVAFAEEEFCEDYGMCFKYVWDQFKLWKVFFENMDMKLDNILGILSQQNTEKQIQMLSGKKVKGGKNSDGSTK